MTGQYPDLQLVTLNRPKALNALSSSLFKELNDALSKYDNDQDIGTIVLTGSEKAFAGEFYPTRVDRSQAVARPGTNTRG